MQHTRRTFHSLSFVFFGKKEVDNLYLILYFLLYNKFGKKNTKKRKKSFSYATTALIIHIRMMKKFTSHSAEEILYAIGSVGIREHL